ncbi:MAG: double-strand break repair protein AddB [Proteobacteria bacterium]|nr:double-strand break repair protein AddB [Pseudomonadota bacterium]
MFDPSGRPRVFALPPGADFPTELVRGLIARLGGAPPEAMARVTLYLNTGRMMRSVRAAFDRTGARLLPRLRLVSDLALDPVPGLPLPVAPLSRRFDLMRLVSAMLNDGTDLAEGRAAFDLADSLATLLEEMEGEGVPAEAFEAPDFAEDHARHWERSLAFLRIATRYLSDDSRPDPEGRRRRVVDWLAGRWQEAPPVGPVLVAGSTGSRGTTQALMRAVAALPQGAVILPGFDFGLPEDVWNSLDSGIFAAEDHPQYRYRALLRGLDLRPSEVTPWRANTTPDPARNAVLSLALRPAPVTDRWLSDGPALGPLPPAMAGVTVLEAAAPREEAMAIALVLREAVENGRRAALISPDRVLTRRVTAALDRWRLLPDDSAGRPLLQSAPGRFLRQTAALGQEAPGAEVLLALLKHPLTATGAGAAARGKHLLHSRDLELRLRRNSLFTADHAGLQAWLADKPNPAREPWIEWVMGIVEFRSTSGKLPLSSWIETHLELAERIAAGPGGDPAASELWRQDAGEAARKAMRDLAAAAGEAPEMRASDYAGLLDSVLSGGNVRQDEATHPLIAIRGTLEARVQGVDLVILAGLNDGVWPGTPAPDPWLSRQMRRRAGLLSPERKIGLEAHDFQQAAGAPQVFLSRALRGDDSETVPSRWMSRIASLLKGLPAQGGVQAWDEMRGRGERWLRLARASEEPEPRYRTAPALRPSPRPPVEARPRSLSVTAISRLIRDPYAVYAEKILRLKRLEPLARRPDARLRGMVLHKIMEEFVKRGDPSEDATAALARLRDIAQSEAERLVPWSATRNFYLARLDRIAPAFIADEMRRAARGRPQLIEDRGETSLDSLDFTLTARPDRIDLLQDGRVQIYDYKTGKPPTFPQQTHFDKQLRLEAAMAERGAFEILGTVTVEGATHIGLGSDDGEFSAKLTPEIIAESWAGLHKLIAAYLGHETGYTARRAVFETRITGDYDHLARLGEWEMSDAPVPEDVG